MYILNYYPVFWRHTEEKMILAKGKYYLQREEQADPIPPRAKRYVDCRLCQVEYDSTTLGNKRKSNNYGKGYRLGRIMAHYIPIRKDS
jgi:hypothetical protein